jgi:hypothetical protein
LDDAKLPIPDDLNGIESAPEYLASALLDPLFWPAERLGAASAWWLHVPFAHWIITAAKPRCFVELGTHTGVSYSAFCQAVARGQLDTRCHAVDTWRGDPQAGEYSGEIFEEFRSFHDERYAAFSTLLRCTFDEALTYFDDKTIDLLHIDGLHTYDAVRHDFESWLPKLSDRGVVIFHDIHERQDDFGVWRIWAELRKDYAGFEFLHGHGLGVLAVGARAPNAITRLTALEGQTAAVVRERFHGLGERWLAINATNLLKQTLVNSSATSAAAVAEATARAEKVESEATARARRWEERASTLKSELAQAKAKAAYTEQKLSEAQARAEQADRDILEIRAALEKARTQRDALLDSTSWKASLPIRVLGSYLPKTARRMVRGGAELAWRSLTLQRARRLRQSRQLDRNSTARNADAHLYPLPHADVQQSKTEELAGPPATVPALDDLVRERFAALQPLRTYSAPHHAPRVTVVTDSINAGSLYGGVGTAIIFATLLAERLGADLRLVTRNEPPLAANLGTVLRTHGISFPLNVELVYSPVGPGGRDIPSSPNDLYLTTSWWTTRAALGAVPSDRIVYLLQEDERMFYPAGDDQLLCTETLSSPSLFYVVNSNLLLEHLQSAGLAPGAIAFEPAFPSTAYDVARTPERSGRRNFFFYSRPHNVRNLFWRGAEAIGAAIEQGVFDEAEWVFHFVGKDTPELVLPRGIRPRIAHNLPWPAYAALVRRVDVGLSLMYTPHPSYPPLDLAASGAVVVTNCFGNKTCLKRYSRNILCVGPAVSDLVDGLREAVTLAADTKARASRASGFGMPRDWAVALAPVLNRIAERCARS